ncbi:GDP dissociation inhibitor, putative [Plasmodium malariae]|uniref:GDP dissociation inhibitor, putative n=1 Tax=Plasmodium malariae TaxID=5858 RepID=A0A1D3RJH6_PLAMA|nr:GDP dissociation inhibitor, putative [Plasmodium malariae]SCN45274.1 GDP dissociation inhibitor, putative [Plasmodium malariae]
MEDREITTFNCDILICGTSLLNSLLSSYFSINNYKVINIDKNNYYGDVNCSLNFNQFQEQKVNLENFYEEYLPFSSNIQDEVGGEKKKLMEEIIQNYFQLNNNKFNIDLNPKILYNESNIVSLLVSLNAHTYVNFVGIQHFYLTSKKDNTNQTIITNSEKTQVSNTQKEKHKNKTVENMNETCVHSLSTIDDEKEDNLILLKIPLNRSQVFLDNNLNLSEKRMIMNFIYKNIVHDKNYTFSNFSNYNFVKKANVTQQEFLLQNNESVSSKIIRNTADNYIYEKGKNVCNKKEPFQHEEQIEEKCLNVSICEFLKSYNINDKITDYIIYGIGLFDLELGYRNDRSISQYYLSGYTKDKMFVMNKGEFLQRLHILVNSLNKFKLQNLFENAFIYPSYGLNDIIYAISRVASLNNSIYMINRKIKNIILSDFYINNVGRIENNNNNNNNTFSFHTSSKIKEIVLDNGHIIRPNFVISSGSNINFYEMKKYLFCKNKSNKAPRKEKIQIKTNRLVVLSTYSLIGKNGLSFYIHKQPKMEQQQEKEGGQKKKEFYNMNCSVHILQLDHSSGSCPLGFFLTYFTYLEIEKKQNQASNISNNGKNEDTKNQKPLNFMLLFNVLKLFVKKHRFISNTSVDSYLPVKIPFDEQILNKIADFFSTQKTQNIISKEEVIKVRETENEENNQKNNQKNDLKSEVINMKLQKESIKNGPKQDGGNERKQAQFNETKRQSSIKAFNDLLTNEGIIYYAYYEYKPVVYRKDTIKLINQNVQNYRKIFENIKKLKEQNQKQKLEQKQEMCENQKNEVNKRKVNCNNNSDISETTNKTNENKDANIHERNNNCNLSYSNQLIGIDENKNICNLLFTNDIHNYPIYPLIEDISMFFYIINKIHNTFFQSHHGQTIYDTYTDVIKTFFNNRTAHNSS